MSFQGKRIDEATAGLIRGILEQLNETTFNALYADRDIAQALLDDACTAVNDCNVARGVAFSADFPAELLVNETRDNHTECKNHEDVGQGNLHDEAERLCTQQDNVVRTFTNCGATAHGQTSDSDSVYAWFQCLDTFTTRWCDNYTIGRETCENATTDFEDAQIDCHEKQGNFERAVCQLHLDILDECSTYDGCWDSAHGSWITTSDTVRDMEILYKAQMQALEQLLCFGNSIINNYTDYDHCEFDTCDECPRMILNYCVPDPKITCDEPPQVPNVPCDPAWLAVEYSQWSGYNGEILADCIPCPGAGGVTTTAMGF